MLASELGIARHEGEHGFLNMGQMSATVGDDIVTTDDVGHFLRDHILIDPLYITHERGYIDRFHEANRAMHPQQA